MWSYTPQGGKKWGPVLLIAFPMLSLLPAGWGILLSGLPRHILFALALFLTAAGTALTVRLQLPEYTYEISDPELPGQYDLTVTMRLGKRRQVACRVSVAGTLQKTGKKQPKKVPHWLCCRLFGSGQTYLFFPPEAKEEYALILCPNEEMLQVMKSLGVTVIE